MFKIFYPYEYVKSVFVIDYNKLYNKGYRGLIFDIDNTLVHHGEDSTEKVEELFNFLQQIGFKTLILSNNSEKRIKRFLKNINSPYIYDAQKPAVSSYLKGIEILKLRKEEVVMIGDQIFTDIWGANRSGIASILVEFIRKENEIKIGKKRQIEKIILEFYKRNKKCQNRIGNIVKKEV